MKLPTKPISSPGRPEKYPPPLMRFLRTNAGSRSRGRSRSSPMFVRKKSTAAATAAGIETQEPSSPKVTCMGQVRVNRSKQHQSKPRSGKSKRRRCKWIRNALFAGKLKPKCSKPDWRKWWGVMFFHCGFKRKSKIKEDSSKIEPKFSNRTEDSDDGDGGGEEDEEEDERKTAKEYYFSTAAAISPPKNALMLTRSRSAPYRSSSLACRFWGSPSEESDYPQKLKSSSDDEIRLSESKESDYPQKLKSSSDDEIRLSESKESEEEVKLDTEIEVSIVNPTIGSVDDVVHHPLILTRCKSEPARIAEKLDPELSFWKNRRLGFT